MQETLTVDETSFPNAKPRDALLIAYKAFADLAGKASLFVIVIVAARRLTPESFGLPTHPVGAVGGGDPDELRLALPRRVDPDRGQHGGQADPRRRWQHRGHTVHLFR